METTKDKLKSLLEETRTAIIQQLNDRMDDLEAALIDERTMPITVDADGRWRATPIEDKPIAPGTVICATEAGEYKVIAKTNEKKAADEVAWARRWCLDKQSLASKAEREPVVLGYRQFDGTAVLSNKGQTQPGSNFEQYRDAINHR